MRASDKRRMHRSGRCNIGTELRPAFEKSIIFKPRQSGPNSELAHDKLLAIERSRSG